MKHTIYMIFGVIVILLVSCENNKITSFETETFLDFNIPLVAADVDSVKSAVSFSEIDYSFSGEGTYNGVRIANIENNLYYIQKVKPANSPLLSIAGILEEGAFHSLQLEWGIFSHDNAGYKMEPPIDLMQLDYLIEEDQYQVVLTNELLQLINSLNENPENDFIVRLKGSSNLSLNTFATLKIPVIVESTPMNVRFELF